MRSVAPLVLAHLVGCAVPAPHRLGGDVDGGKTDAPDGGEVDARVAAAVDGAPLAAVCADPQSQAADPLAHLSTRTLLDWLIALPGREDDRLMSGHFAGYSGTSFGLAETEALHGQTGQRPQILSCDYASGWTPDPAAPGETRPTTVDHSCNAALIDWSRAGGVVTITVHSPRPDDDAGWRQPLARFADLADPTTEVGIRWREQLDALAAGLRQLDDADVPVLFRPLHEMNGAWFWWGGQPAGDFVAVWRDMFDYLTVTHGLHNLLWVFSASGIVAGGATSYPGDDVVDVVGLDVYLEDPTDSHGYDELSALGKPFGFTEIGAPPGQLGSFDFALWTAAIRARFPATALFLAWNEEWGPLENPGGAALLTDPWVVNRGEIVPTDCVDP